MNLPDGITLLATVCNTVPHAVPFTLWMARGDKQYLVDMSEALDQRGDAGLTGMVWYQDKLYIAVQSSAARILVLDRQLSLLGTITSQDFVDLHSLHVLGDSLAVLSTGAGSVLQLDIPNGTADRLCQFERQMHLNAACFDGQELLVCCQPPERHGVLNVNTGRMVLDGMKHPHSLMRSGDAFLALDSAGSRVIRFDQQSVRQQVTLSGFLRGCTAARGTLYVGSSTSRVVSRKNPTMSPARELWHVMAEQALIYELDEATLALRATHAPILAGYELYELLALDGDLIDPPAERLLSPTPGAMAHFFYDSAKLLSAEAKARAANPG